MALRPVTIKQILEAKRDPSTDTFMIDGTDVNHVTIVAQVRSAAIQSLKFIYRLDDGTGNIDAQEWLDTRSQERVEQGTLQPISLDTYVRAFGTISEFGHKPILKISNLRMIEDFNEVSYHFLEVTLVHLENTKGSPEEMTDGRVGSKDVEMVDLNVDLSTVSPNARKLYSYFKTHQTEISGILLSDVASALAMGLHSAQEAVTELTSSAILMETKDDEHFGLIGFGNDGY